MAKTNGTKRVAYKSNKKPKTKQKPKDDQREPTGIQREPTVGTKEAKGGTKTPKRSQMEKIYKNKLPINRPTGRYDRVR